MPVAWLNPAGGLRYHVRARLAARHWQPFRVAIADWLPTFDAPRARALLVGPSAGYTFPDVFFRQFSAITVLEPDPIAGFLICRRLRNLGISTRLERSDRLIAPLLHGGGHGLEAELQRDPAACLIFGNLLGQTRFLLRDPDFERFKLAFRERIEPLLTGRAWLSFHDRVSGSLAPNFRQPYAAPERLNDRSVLGLLYPSPEPGAKVELFDHESGGFFPSNLPHTYFHWQLGRGRHHLIEGVISNPESWRSGALG